MSTLFPTTYGENGVGLSQWLCGKTIVNKSSWRPFRFFHIFDHRPMQSNPFTKALHSTKTTLSGIGWETCYGYQHGAFFCWTNPRTAESSTKKRWGRAGSTFRRCACGETMANWTTSVPLRFYRNIDHRPFGERDLACCGNQETALGTRNTVERYKIMAFSRGAKNWSTCHFASKTLLSRQQKLLAFPTNGNKILTRHRGFRHQLFSLSTKKGHQIDTIYICSHR